MDQVFCSEPLVGDQQSVLEEIEQELATISPLLPDGEKTFERFLSLLAKLLSLRSAADPRPGCDAQPADESDNLTQQVYRLEHDIEEAKGQVRLSGQQLIETEEEILKLLADKSQTDQLIKSLYRQVETLQLQNSDQSK